MSIFAFICPYQLLTLKKKVTFCQLFSRPGPCDPYVSALAKAKFKWSLNLKTQTQVLFDTFASQS